MYIVKRASYRPPHTPTRGPHHQCSQGYEPQHQTAAGISSQAPHSSPQLKARCPCFQRGVLAGTTGRSPNSLLIPRGRGGSCPMVWRDGAEHVRMTCGRAYSHLSRQANLRDCTALRRDVGQDIPAPARRGSGSGHGDPVDVGTAWHSHLMYLWEITVNDRVHTYFPISTDTSQRRTEVKTSVAFCYFLICSSTQ